MNRSVKIWALALGLMLALSLGCAGAFAAQEDCDLEAVVRYSKDFPAMDLFERSYAKTEMLDARRGNADAAKARQQRDVGLKSVSLDLTTEVMAQPMWNEPLQTRSCFTPLIVTGKPAGAGLSSAAKIAPFSARLSYKKKKRVPFIFFSFLRISY